MLCVYVGRNNDSFFKLFSCLVNLFNISDLSKVKDRYMWINHQVTIVTSLYFSTAMWF